MMTDGDQQPKIQIDSDWKSQAQAEKTKLREDEQKAAESGQDAAGAQGKMPPANWETLVQTLASQAVMYMGAIADPNTGQPILDLEAAKHGIDLLGVLEEKTKGVLSEDEAKDIARILHELRSAYIQIVQQISAMQAGAGAIPGGTVPGGAVSGGAGTGDLGAIGGSGGIQTPG